MLFSMMPIEKTTLRTVSTSSEVTSPHVCTGSVAQTTEFIFNLNVTDCSKANINSTLKRT